MDETLFGAPPASADLFEVFYASYPRKRAAPAARKAFARLCPSRALVETMLAALERQKRSREWADPTYIPYPATWLNQRRWEDAVEDDAPVMSERTRRLMA